LIGLALRPFLVWLHAMGRLREGANSMKTFIVACVAAIIIAVIGGVVLSSVQEPVDKAFSTTSVRLGA
jgi:hypothetical protein